MMTSIAQPSFSQMAKKLFTLALPIASVQFVTMGSSFLCMVMLAKLGHTVLAASALFFTTQMSILIIGMSILFSISILVGHAFGAKNYLLIGNYIQQGWSLG